MQFSGGRLLQKHQEKEDVFKVDERMGEANDGGAGLVRGIRTKHDRDECSRGGSYVVEGVEGAEKGLFSVIFLFHKLEFSKHVF